MSPEPRPLQHPPVPSLERLQSFSQNCRCGNDDAVGVAPPALLCGIGLLLLPFLVPAGGIQVGLALLLMALPFLIGRR